MAPRERRPALAALAVLLILVGALGTTVMVLRAGSRRSAVEITASVAAGHPIPASAIREVRVAAGTDVKYIGWDQRADLMKNFRASADIPAGAVLVRSLVTEGAYQLPPGKALVGLSLKKGRYPEGLDSGLTVAAYPVGAGVDTAADGGGSVGPGGLGALIGDHLVIKAISADTSGGFGDGTETVTVLADLADAGPLAAASASGDVSLVLVPGDN